VVSYGLDPLKYSLQKMNNFINIPIRKGIPLREVAVF